MADNRSRNFSGRSPYRSIDYGSRKTPWVEMKTFSFHPTIYKTMLGKASPDAGAGDIVTVYDRKGQIFGSGLYNPSARVPLRVYQHGEDAFDEESFLQLLSRAIALRKDTLNLEAGTQAYRVVHSDGDGLSGLVVDRLGDCLSVQVHSLGIYQRLPKWIPFLKEQLGAESVVVEVDEKIAMLEGIRIDPSLSDEARFAKFEEHGIRYEADFRDGHKTGFFCDQRDNRLRFGQLAKGKDVLDVCCYTGGFALNAMVNGGAESVTAVDLDEKAIAQAKRNANLNGQARVNWTHCDAFSFMRQMQRNGNQWDLVNLDPPKLIFSKEQQAEGMKKYEDLNQLACTLVKPGGVMATYSCSGQLSAEDFEAMVIRSAHRAGRRLQILDRTGAGADHPVMSNCPESRYLKALWSVVW
ncbi:class I SAM-dependent rRNA methyltransferase [Pelagicoccus sp. SDUM812003]|uniref:class I SAM-dependent rRNA methyltransferase n=1 Tax=Pelagicoccus sp. SDUM812003 TaxID=3041267 RepID=UPI00280F661E|nr:class I SAM-dependent rRNA methyltransferase [Pelagicoccus sp. SDUM812003]MDQ8203531.1 class I SAM-dependent rRNA methyltransferase [Pelagicoccus sp. SDUM812003]